MRWWMVTAVILLAGCTSPADVPEDEHDDEPYFDSGMMAPGATFSFTFPEVHEEGYSYHCHPHPWMTGMVHVMPDTDGQTTTVNVDILEEGGSDEWGYSVEHLEIEVGDTVVWTNTGALEHTVTESAGGDHDHMHM